MNYYKCDCSVGKKSFKTERCPDCGSKGTISADYRAEVMEAEGNSPKFMEPSEKKESTNKPVLTQRDMDELEKEK